MTSPPNHRTLLLPRQPISKPTKSSKPLNPSAHPADVELRSTIIATGSRQRSESGSGQKQEAGREGQGGREDREDDGDGDETDFPVIEFDSSKAPQPFLDGSEALERMKAAGRV